MTPGIAAHRLLLGLTLGGVLGLWYGFLRPLRQKNCVIADTLFLLGAGYSWLYLGFALCGGDLRLGYFLALGIGAFGWEATVGRWLRPVFRWIWNILDRLWGLFLLPFKKIFKFLKILFEPGGRGT